MSVEVIATLLFAASLIVLVAYAVVRSRWPSREEALQDHESVHEAPLDVLKRRYGNGEITREEYEREKKRTAA